MTVRTNAERQMDWANKHRALGRTQRKLWAHPEDWHQIYKYIDRKNKSREKKSA